MVGVNTQGGQQPGIQMLEDQTRQVLCSDSKNTQVSELIGEKDQKSQTSQVTKDFEMNQVAADKPEDILKEMAELGISKKEVASLLCEMEMFEENEDELWDEERGSVEVEDGEYMDDVMELLPEELLQSTKKMLNEYVRMSDEGRDNSATRMEQEGKVSMESEYLKGSEDKQQ
jgi:hypothetical protein